MSQPPPLVADNIAQLELCADVLDGLPAQAYAAADERCLGGSIGGHVRHCLEHYASFLSGLDGGRIDYEQRARDRRLQVDVGTARAELRRTASTLARTVTFARLDRPLRVIAEGDASDGEVTASTIGRELSFLLSHTIHHCALIAVLMRLRGLEAPGGFGLAPATRRHRAQQPAPPAGRIHDTRAASAALPEIVRERAAIPGA